MSHTKNESNSLARDSKFDVEDVVDWGEMLLVVSFKLISFLSIVIDLEEKTIIYSSVSYDSNQKTEVHLS